MLPGGQQGMQIFCCLLHNAAEEAKDFKTAGVAHLLVQLHPELYPAV
jgi:hypothetical protein